MIDINLTVLRYSAILAPQVKFQPLPIWRLVADVPPKTEKYLDTGNKGMTRERACHPLKATAHGGTVRVLDRVSCKLT